MANKRKIEIIKDTAGEYRWSLKAGNGEIVATSSEGYSSKSGAKQSAKNLKKWVKNTETVDKTDKFPWQ